jgi:ubiquitin C-terminal hydrolase
MTCQIYKTNRRIVFNSIIFKFLFKPQLLQEYIINGIVCHRGGSSSGHYFAYVRTGDNFVELNDKNITKNVSLQTASENVAIIYADLYKHQ